LINRKGSKKMKLMPKQDHLLNRPCPICENRTGLLLDNLHFEVFDNLPIASDFPIAICDKCGLGYYDTPSRQTDFNRYYQGNAYYYTAESTGSGGTTREDTRRFEAIVNRLKPYISQSDAAIFDIGCAKGGLLKVLAEHGYSHLHGVDMLPACVEHIKHVLGLSAEIGSALELPFSKVSADVLIYSQIIEHVIDLHSLVIAAHEKLNHHGILYIEVPDASRYTEYATLPYQYLYLEHVNHFNKAQLINLFGKGGFSLLDAGVFCMETEYARWPSLWAVFGKSETEMPKFDSNLEHSLRSYLNWSAHHSTLDMFAQLAQARTPLWVWGISQYAMLLLGQSLLGKSAICGLVDQDPYKQTKSVMGLPIQSPEVLRGLGPDHTVLVTAVGYEEQIFGTLQEMGFSGTVLTLSGKNCCEGKGKYNVVS